MARGAPIRTTDLRGAARLAADATAGLADVVEAMHERVARLPGVAAPARAGRTTGVTGLVYRTVRAVTHGVGGSVDVLLHVLDRLAPVLGTARSSARREAVIAALNGVLGDHLVATANPLATPMTLQHGGETLPNEPAALAAALPGASHQVLVMIHGLCMNDRQWRRADGHDHGIALARRLGFTPLYLRYNSGLHVSVNGRGLADRLEALVDAWPQASPRLVLIGHSMGGLVARSAVHQAQGAGQRWPRLLSDMVFIGTPHHGAPLERVGHGVDVLLAATPYTAPLARLAQLRSAGITDLRHARLLDADRVGLDRFATAGAPPPTAVPLPAGVRCHAIASTLGKEPGSRAGHWLGDGLVPIDSALGRHADPARCLGFEPERVWVGRGIGHLDLLGSREVHDRLLRWLGPRRSAAAASPGPVATARRRRPRPSSAA